MGVRWIAALAAMAFSAGAGTATAAFTVDGRLDDWGISLADGNGSSWGLSPSSGTGPGSGFTFRYHLEDQDDYSGDNFFLGPNHGGQNYDGEFLGAGSNGTHLLIAVATGQRPDNGFQRFAPGDIRIMTSAGSFGVEVGGGAGDTSTSRGEITEGALGTTYELTSQGFTSGVLHSDGDLSDARRVQQTAGSVWKNPVWIVDPLTNEPFTEVQIQFKDGALKGQADYIYTLDSDTSQHAVIELAIPLHFFAGATISSVEWAPSCGNDVLAVTGLELPSVGNIGGEVPVPGGLALLGSALVSFCGYRTVRRRSSEAHADAV